MTRKHTSLLAVGLALVVVQLSVAAEFSWQDPKAEVLPTGDLQWTPQSFEYEHGDSVRYIDFENGDDDNDGLTKQSPWKRHPWD
ncbi:MAG: hypothetical protein JJ992_09025, partial [Planctomycetes bacterium]|nr:hypothetical protein [Planctomycetota bacterium]